MFYFKNKNIRGEIQSRTSAFDPLSLVAFFGVLSLSLLPFVLNMLGIDLSTSSKIMPSSLLENGFYTDQGYTPPQGEVGSFSHALLEWTVFCTAIFTAILSFIHYRVTKDVTIPIVGLALFFAGVMNAFHTLSDVHLVDSLVGNQDLIVFTRELCRLFNIGVMILSLGFLLLYSPHDLKKKKMGFILGVGFFLLALIYTIIQWSMTSPSLSQTQFPHGIIKQPYDVLLLFLFVFAAVFVYYPFYKRSPSLFSYALLLSLIPQSFIELQSFFVTKNLFDNHFNISHFLKFFGYLIPFIGLCFEYISSYKKSESASRELSSVNQKLDLALSQAQIATKAKSNFLASVTHELRTPMNGVIGMANLLSETNLDKEQTQQVDIIKGCANSLLVVINDILDFSKIEAGKMDIELLPFNVRKMCKETLELVRFQAEGKDLKLELEFHEGIPHYVKGDPNRLRQIILNFLSNAIKFTMKGHVKLILCCPEGISRNQNQSICIRFAVEDTGVGVPENVADSLFKPFSQADSTISRKFGGTGLGLAISRKLATLMQGRIWLKSIAKKGSTFYLEVSLAQANQREIEDLQKRNQGTQETLEYPNFRILLAEDNQTNQLVALSILKKIGVVADVANNGLEVLEALDNKAYDLIFMDMMMPEMDGLETTKEICNRFKKGYYQGIQKPRIIAMTANTMPEDRERCLKAGMDEFMAKPIVLSDLREKILSTPHITPAVHSVENNTTENVSFSQNSLDLNRVVSFTGRCFESQKLLEAFKEDRDLIPSMIDLFLKTSLDYMRHIKEDIETQNSNDLQLHSHTFKGSVKMFYANRAIEISQSLEDLGKKQNLEAAQKLYNELEEEFSLLQKELKEFKKHFSSKK